MSILKEITNHPNIVRFCGVVVDRSPPLVVTEYYPYGSLYSLLQKARKQKEGDPSRVRRGEEGVHVHDDDWRGGRLVAGLTSHAGAGVWQHGLMGGMQVSHHQVLRRTWPPGHQVTQGAALALTLPSVCCCAPPPPSSSFPSSLSTPPQPQNHADYLHWKRRLAMLQDVASGMIFMHNRWGAGGLHASCRG